MKIRTLICVSVCALLFAFALSADSMAAGKAKDRAKFELPVNAAQVAPNVYYLGKAKDKGREVEGYAIVKHKGSPAKPTCGNGVCEAGETAKKCPADCGSGGAGDPGTSDCYGFLARGAKWKTVEPYMVDPTNIDGLTSGAVAGCLVYGIGEWENAAGADILGDEIAAVLPLQADTVSPDDRNEVYFADVSDDGAIAITIVWGIFGGPPQGRELVEWDQIYDDVDFDWAGGDDPTRMDFVNIAIHELGHSCGLADLYDAKCSEQTMYGYATECETKKQTLEDGDIAGIRNLYK